MKLFKKLITYIQESDNVQYINTITDLKKANKLLIEKNIALETDFVDLKSLYNDLDNTNSKLIKENDELKNQLEPTKTTHDTFFKLTAISYPWKPGKNERLSNTLQHFSNNLEAIDKYNKFCKNVLQIKSYPEPDKIVYATTIKVLDYVEKFRKKYVRDIDNFGSAEYWMDFNEAYDFYVNNKKAGDCDDKRIFLYCCIISQLIVNGLFSESWRLKCIDGLITNSEGHALLGWKKENNIWSPIETTYGQNYFKENWNRNADIFKSMYFHISHIFDERGEYLLK